MSKLVTVLEQIREKIERYKGQGKINEQNTKAALIQPVLRALGWDVEDLDEVQFEYRRTPKDNPVDYALLLSRVPVLFVEAKSLGENIEERKWSNQVLVYASMAGVEWVVLTDGDEYRIFNSHAAVPVEEKVFRVIRISEDVKAAADTLALLSRSRMHDKQIDQLWNAHFVDRQIKTALDELFMSSQEPDAALVRLLKKRIPNLSPAEIRTGIQRLEATFRFPVDLTTEPATEADENDGAMATRAGDSKATGDGAQPRKRYDVRTAELIEAGILAAPVTLYRRYKGQLLEARLLADGSLGARDALCGLSIVW